MSLSQQNTTQWQATVDTIAENTGLHSILVMQSNDAGGLRQSLAGYLPRRR